MIALIDNYDSFTYNLVQYLETIGLRTRVYRNDRISVADLLKTRPRAIVLSPGPGDPDSAGICLDVIHAAARKAIPLLGVCLGHQAIGQAFGGKIIRTTPLHGKTSPVHHDGKGLFKSMPAPFNVARYHSLVIDPATMPKILTATAHTKDGIIMACQHKNLPIYGVQFHPESIATQNGMTILENFKKSL